MQTIELHKKILRILPLLLFMALIIIGLSFFLGSFVKFEYVRSRLFSIFPYHCKRYFTRPIFEEITVRARIAGLMVFFAAAVLLQLRSKIEKYISEAASSFSVDIKGVFNSLRNSFKGISRIHSLSISAILVLAFGIRLYLLNQPMRYDEAVTFLRFASKPLYFGLSNYFSTNNHLFHTFLVHISWLLFGNALWAIRLPAFIAGILIVPTAYLLIKSFYNRYAALFCAGIVAGSYIMVSYSVNARGYTLLALIFLILLGLAARIVRKDSKALWLIFSIVAALGFYTMPVMLYAYGVVITWFFITGISKRKKGLRLGFIKNLFLSLIQTGLITALLYLPVFIVSCFVTVKKVPSFIQRDLLDYIMLFPSHLKQVFLLLNAGLPTHIIYLLAIGFILCLTYHGKVSKYRLPIVLAAVIWFIPALLTYRVFPYARTYIWFIPIYMGVSTCGLTYPIMIFLRNKYIKDTVLSLAGVFVTALIILTVSCPPVGIKSATATLAPSLAKRTAVARPMPDAAPVIKATFPSSLPICYTSSVYAIEPP